MDHKGTRLYNILFPLWMLIFIPSWLWVLLIPLNYLIDRVVLRWSLGDLPEKGAFCRRHTWKICLAGFTSDFIGALLLLGVFFFGVLLGIDEEAFFETVQDRWIRKKAGLSLEQAKKSAIRLALITAPYLYLFPTSVIYNNFWVN